MDQPIACSLDADGARSQLDEWRDALAASASVPADAATILDAFADLAHS